MLLGSVVLDVQVVIVNITKIVKFSLSKRPNMIILVLFDFLLKCHYVFK